MKALLSRKVGANSRNGRATAPNTKACPIKGYLITLARPPRLSILAASRSLLRGSTE